MVEADHSEESAQPESRQSRRRKKTRAAVYRAALRLFEERGFEETTVQAITEAADVGKGTFFNHFPTKDHVLVAYWDEFNAHLLDELEAIRKRTVKSRLLTAMEICGQAAAAEHSMGRILLGRVFTSRALMDSDRENEVRLTSWLQRVLQDGVERGELRRDADLESFSHLFIANLSSTFRDYILYGGESPAELMSRRLRVLLRGIERTS